MAKQVIVITESAVSIPKTVKIPTTEFLASSFHVNAYVLIDRSYVSTKEIYNIKKHCEANVLFPLINGSYFDTSYIFIPDWNIEDEEQAYNSEVMRVLHYLKEAESERISYEIEELEQKAHNKNVWIDHPIVKRIRALVAYRKAIYE